MPNVSINSYCSFTPGGQHNTITGTIKTDINNNGCDAGDPARGNAAIKMTSIADTSYTTTDASGNYSFFPYAGTYTLTPQVNGYFISSPVSADISFATQGGDTQTRDFCIVPNGIHHDLEITIIPVSAVRPGFPITYRLVYMNNGTETESGSATLNFDAGRMNFLTSSPLISSQSSGSLTWNYTNLLPLGTGSINLSFTLLPPPVNNVNDSIHFTGTIEPQAGDETPSDNIFSIDQIVTSSFDPNDKRCVEGKFIDISKTGDFLHYVIHFQNDGTDTAFNIVVKDLLSGNYDWNSIEITATSHPCVLRQSDGNKLEFIFNNIQLPPQATNDAASSGFVAFKVKPVNTIHFRDSLINNASIFFDFNLPVITNDAITIIDSANIVPVTIEYFRGQKKDGTNLLTWKANCDGEVTFDVEKSTGNGKFTSIGALHADAVRCREPFDFTDSNPVDGINQYRIRITDADGKITYSNIITLLNKQSGFEIVNLAPNPVKNTAVLTVVAVKPQQLNIRVLDVTGRPVYELLHQAPAGSSMLNMGLTGLPKGIYLLTIFSAEGQKRTIKFVKE